MIMKRTTPTLLVVTLSIGHALAASDAPGPTLDPAQCTAVWSLTERQGDILMEDKARPFIVNFKMVDADGDGRITQEEFKKGCKGGLVKSQKMSPNP
jgi:hypothetical protein